MFLQHFPAARQPLFYVVFGEFQLFGHGFDGLLFAIKKHERLAVNFRNAFERTPENRLFFVTDCLIGGQWFERMGFGNFLERRGFAHGFAAFAAEKIIDAVARDAAQPRAEFFAFA